MEPIKTNEATRPFGPPQGMTEDDCATLWVQEGRTPEGLPFHKSAWKMAPEELAEANANGGIVYLTIYGPGHPMVSVSVFNPKENDGQQG